MNSHGEKIWTRHHCERGTRDQISLREQNRPMGVALRKWNRPREMRGTKHQRGWTEETVGPDQLSLRDWNRPWVVGGNEVQNHWEWNILTGVAHIITEIRN